MYNGAFVEWDAFVKWQDVIVNDRAGVRTERRYYWGIRDMASSDDTVEFTGIGKDGLDEIVARLMDLKIGSRVLYFPRQASSPDSPADYSVRYPPTATLNSAVRERRLLVVVSGYDEKGEGDGLCTWRGNANRG